MSKRRIAAATALCAALAPFAAPSVAQAAYGDSCYVVSVRDYAPNEYTFMSLTQQAMRQGERAGLSVYGIANQKFMACGAGATVYSTYSSNGLITKLTHTSVKSNEVQTFRIYIRPSSMMNFPERSPMFLAMQDAHKAGLEVVDGPLANYLYVMGTPSQVFGVFDPASYIVRVA